jgi:hypothetical protein
VDDGSSITHHSEKVEVLWEVFKSRLGSSACTSMYFDLATLVQHVQLPILDSPFIMEEIQTALNDMPIDHAPDPDRFNGMFMKRCWPIIQEDFIRFFAQFCSGDLNIELINGCYITLISKKGAPLVLMIIDIYLY